MENKEWWRATCEYPLGIKRFNIKTDSEKGAYRFANAYEKDGFFRIRVEKCGDDDANRT